MTGATSGGRGLTGACGLFTCLLMIACGAETPTVTYPSGDVQVPQPPASEEPTVPPREEPGRPPPVVSTPPPPVVPAPSAPSVPTGRSWYVSVQGSDVASGTREAPLRTVGRAVTLARPGEVIRVLPGVYSETLLLESKGTGVAAVTLRGEGSPRPRIVPASTSRSAVIRVQGRWNLENLQLDVGGARMFAVLFTGTAGQSSLSGSELNGGTSGAGVVVEGASGITIQNNIVRHFIQSGTDSHGVAVVGPVRGLVIRNNDIHHNSGDSIQCQGYQAPVENVLIEGNTLHDEGENAVDIKGCRNVTIRGNSMFGFPNAAVRPVGSSAGEAIVLHQSASSIVVQGNTISRAGRGVSVLAASTPSESIWVKDNHFQDIRNMPVGNGQAVRIARARKVWVEGNLIENTASYGLMLAADGTPVEGLVVRNNTLKGGTRSFLLLRLGPQSSRPGIVLEDNHYAEGGVLKADGVLEQLTLSSPDKLGLWQQALRADQGATLLE